MCSGYGGLDEGVLSVLDAKLVWVADNDPAAAEVLRYRYPSVPNLGDIRLADWSGVDVDVLLGGFPCQPVSQAGRKRGMHDQRWLFDDIMVAVDNMAAKPRIIVLENVFGLLSANHGEAMEHVLGSLAARGYVGQYRTVRASESGAPHRRERVFILARLEAAAHTVHHGQHDSQNTGAHRGASLT
jgi:DNA (cytosine-5)-methyltransferase 1